MQRCLPALCREAAGSIPARADVQRFWPQFEAWLAHTHGTECGLEASPEAKMRCTIECLRDLSKDKQFILETRWANCEAKWAYRLLSHPTIEVTNQSDKEMQLHKVGHLDYMVKRQLRASALSESATPEPSAPPTMPAIEGLAELLEKADAVEQLELAMRWFEVEGLKSVASLARCGPEMVDVFVAALELKRGQKILLKQTLDEAVAERI